MQDQDVQVRSNVADALGNIGSEDVVPALMQALQDQNGSVRDASAQALEKIGTPEALKAVDEYQSQQ